MHGITGTVVQTCSVKNPLLKISKKFIRKHLCKRIQHRCFLVNFAKSFRTPVLFEQLQIYWHFAQWIVSQYLRYWVFPLGCSFQLILHWWEPNQRANVENADNGGISWYPDTCKGKSLNEFAKLRALVPYKPYVPSYLTRICA